MSLTKLFLSQLSHIFAPEVFFNKNFLKVVEIWKWVSLTLKMCNTLFGYNWSYYKCTLKTELSFFDRKTSEAPGTHHLQVTVTMANVSVVDVVFKCLRQRSNELKICLLAVFYMYVFSWFHWYNKTFIACMFRKYENLFTHEYHIPLGRCPLGIWQSWMNKFSYFLHQHAINV